MKRLLDAKRALDWVRISRYIGGVSLRACVGDGTETTNIAVLSNGNTVAEQLQTENLVDESGSMLENTTTVGTSVTVGLPVLNDVSSSTGIPMSALMSVIVSGLAVSRYVDLQDKNLQVKKQGKKPKLSFIDRMITKPGDLISSLFAAITTLVMPSDEEDEDIEDAEDEKDVGLTEKELDL